MTIAYLDAFSGIAGDMTLAALVDAGADVDYLRQQIQSLGLGDIELDFSETERHCFRALQLDVRHPPEQAHRHLSDIEQLLRSSQLTSRECELALQVFRRLAAAEAKVHGMEIDQVHFHEVGAIDSIVDIVGVAVALNQLGVRRMVASAVPTGCGSVHIAHGLVSVPAPATAELLRGIPIRSTTIEAELTTPTGAAILATLVDGFGPLPDLQIARIGYGAGHKQLVEQANVLRVLIGNSLLEESDEVILLEANLDQASGEQIGYAIERLWSAGALDVFSTAISMKKQRPGTMLSVLARPEQRTALENCLFEHAGTLGIRRQRLSRRVLPRETQQIETPLGSCRVKFARRPSGSVRIAPEYEDCRILAQQHGLRLEDVVNRVMLTAQATATQQDMDFPADSSLAAPPLQAGSVYENDQSHVHNHHHDHDHHHDHGPGGDHHHHH